MDLTFWLRIATVAVSFFVAARFISYAMRERSWVLSSYAIVGIFIGINHSLMLTSTFNRFGDHISILETASGWTSILAVSVLFCGLAHLIREDKPKVARFPIAFTALPLLIILSYPFAHETEVIDEWLFKIYEGGAFVVAVLVYGFQTLKNSRTYYYKVLTGILFLLISYIIFWFLEDLNILQTWGWQSAFIVGIGFIFSGYKEAVND